MSVREPVIIGLIGGIASGKSTVARYLQSRGALWLDSDSMAHEVLNSSEVSALLRARFGDSVIQADGQVDRKQIAASVFGTEQESTAQLAWLESIIHPRVRKMTEDRIADAVGSYRWAIVDAPLLLEAGWGPRCKRILFIDTPREMRAQLAAKRGWKVDELERREAAQMPLEDKRSRATDVIINDGSLEELESKVEQFVRSL